MIAPIKNILINEEGTSGIPTHTPEIPDPYEQTGVPFLTGAGTAIGGSMLYNKLKSRQK